MADEEYARRVAKVVASQMLAAQGVDSVQRSTLDILADLLLRYTLEIGKQSHSYAELSHRTSCSPLDVELALANLGVSASDLLSYANKLDEIPFAQNICQFPLPKTLPQLPSFEDCNEAAPSHIPAFLPAFPEPHARMDTAQFPEAQNDPETRQEKLTEQQKQAQQALLKVQAREAPESDLLKHAARMPEPEKDIALAQQAGQPTLPNPFLAPTVWNGEEGPHPTIPASGAEGQPPIDQGAQWGHLADMEIDEGAASGFRTFKVADGLSTRDVLATSGRTQEDAYGEGMFDDGIGVGDGRRRRLISTGEQQTARVREILAAGGEEAAEGAVVAAEGLPEEEI